MTLFTSFSLKEDPLLARFAVLTRDSSSTGQGEASPFTGVTSHESSRLFAVFNFLMVRLSTTQNMTDWKKTTEASSPRKRSPNRGRGGLR